MIRAVAILVAQLAAGDAADLLDDLDGTAGDRAERAWTELAELGPTASSLALEGFEGVGVGGRRLRARLVLEVGGADDVLRSLELGRDPDAEVRRTLVRFLARPELGRAHLEERIATLARIARTDGQVDLRLAASGALGDFDDERAVQALGRLVRELPPREATWAVRSLPRSARSQALVHDLVVDGLAPRVPTARIPDSVLAAALPLYGRLLADRPGGGESAAERSLLVLGLRHPSGVVQVAAADGLERLLARLRELGEGERALAVLAGLDRQGLDRRVVRFHEARLAFYPAADPERALEAARAIRGAFAERAVAPPRAGGEALEPPIWLFRSLYLEAIAHVALGRADEAHPLLDEAAAVLDGWLSERNDLLDEAVRYRHVDALHQRGILEIARALAALAAGDDPSDGELLEHLHRAHQLSLEAQLLHVRLTGEALMSWDALLDSDLSPFRLLFTGLELPGLAVTRGIELQQALGRGLASVSPRELPGFEPFEGLSLELASPLDDPRRHSLLRRIQTARLDRLTEDVRDLGRRIVETRAAAPELVPLELMAEMERQRVRQLMLARSLNQADEAEGAVELLELRFPSDLALWIARDLRSEGRAEESRRISITMRDDLEETGIASWWYYRGLRRLARIEMSIGSSWTDEGRPEKAEEELKKAVERLESIEHRMVERGASPLQLQPVRALRCTALVSLAVNANVKMANPERALEYYERAYELRQDDFMKILLACYRARSDRGEEARALLREVRLHPGVYYNVACTYALLGDADLALDFLERDFAENYPSEASLGRQRDWAREDPDLESLRLDPRFRHLVGAE